MEFEDNPQVVGDRVMESQRIMQTMMRDQDQLYGNINQGVL